MMSSNPVIFMLYLAIVALPLGTAHAIPITVDSASRSVGASTTVTPAASVSNSSTSGLFAETATSSGTIEAGPISASANQISTISVIGNTLAVTHAGSGTLLTTSFSSDPREPAAPSAFASSALSLQFTIDNWASYTALGVLNGPGPFFSVVAFGNSTNPSNIFLFTDASGSLQTSSGLLGPGVYDYESAAHAIFLSPDRGSLTGSVFSVLTVSIVPEPSTIHFLIVVAAGLGWLRFRTASEF